MTHTQTHLEHCPQGVTENVHVDFGVELPAGSISLDVEKTAPSIWFDSLFVHALNTQHTFFG